MGGIFLGERGDNFYEGFFSAGEGGGVTGRQEDVGGMVLNMQDFVNIK